MNNQCQIFPDDKSLSILEDQTILDASLAADIPHAHACGGKGRCSSCRVIITQGLEHCAPRTEQEDELAKKIGFRDHIRLACQTKVSGPVKMNRAVLDDMDMELLNNDFSMGSNNSLGEEIQATMLFADIEGYTALAEKAMPYDVVHMLNRYYLSMGKIIGAHEGRIMDYFGDGLLAIFGLEKDTNDASNANHASNAVKAAIKMKGQVEILNPYFENLFDNAFNVRVGINTGPVIVGSIGIKGMQKLAAIGDTVNLASRIEAKNKDLGTSFLISQSTHDAINGDVDIASSHEVTFKGKTGTFKVFEVDHMV